MLLVGLSLLDWSTGSLLTLLLAVCLPLLLMPLLWPGRRAADRLCAGRHVLITGGSKGLGLSLALECARRGCSVTVVARNKADLQGALQQLQAAAEHSAAGKAAEGQQQQQQLQRLLALSADTADHEQIKAAVGEAVRAAGPVDILICNAGLSIPGLFVEQGPEAFARQMTVNYLGTVHTLQAALPGMLERRQGRVVVVASALAVLGFAGYSSYAPTKWALRGLADCLHNELQGTGVAVSISYPPDMDTPGYAQENESKPALCRAVNAALGSELFTPDKVAKALLGGIERGQYHLPSPDLGQNLLVAAMTGLSPKRFLLLFHVLLGPLLPLVTSFLTAVMDRAARRHNAAHGMPPRPSAS